MTGIRASTSILLLAACSVFGSALMMQGAQAQNVGLNNGAPPGVLHFELPAESLADAVEAFGRMTGLSVLVGSKLLGGRVSAAVSGDYAPREALQRLLVGTGLQASFTSADGAVLVPGPPSSPPAVVLHDANSAPPIAGAQRDGADYRSYAAMLQTRLADALCRSPQTRPGSYRLLVQLRIDGAGAIVASQLVESTGIAERDLAIEREIRSVTLDSPPPPGMQQPVTILFRPQDDRVNTDCPDSGGQD
jgi:hypothetical protein